MPNRDRDSIYLRVTAEVIRQLELGEVLWRKEWNSLGLPRNGLSGKIYQGWNLFYLNFITQTKGYRAPLFLTFLQAKQQGGHILKGEQGFPVIYWMTLEDKKKKSRVEMEDSRVQAGPPSSIRIPGMHRVFNLDQTAGFSLDRLEKLFRSETGRIPTCEQVLIAMKDPPQVIHQGDRAYYQRDPDRVVLPAMNLFHHDAAYYATLFHELAHSTGHAKRLGRPEVVEGGNFDSDSYSREELTAEFTAAFLCAVCGIGPQTLTNSSAYIRGWLTALRQDKTLVVRAASQAQRAAHYILGEVQEEMEGQEDGLPPPVED
ncbi:MAG: ArdC family protein [Chitinophagaceae bacterium]